MRATIKIYGRAHCKYLLINCLPKLLINCPKRQSGTSFQNLFSSSQNSSIFFGSLIRMIIFLLWLLRFNQACFNKKTALMRIIIRTDFIFAPVLRALIIACIIIAHLPKGAKLLIIRKFINNEFHLVLLSLVIFRMTKKNLFSAAN